jgi:hypothetical protein
MLDERLLARALPRPAQDASASALDEIMHLAQSAKYELAAARAGELLDSGCKDVRAFVVYALGVFSERGPGAVPALFGSIAGAVAAAGESALPPSSLRTFDTALRFGFRAMRAYLDFDERRPEAARRAWSQRLALDSKAGVLRESAALRRAIHAIIEAPLCDAELSAVVARLEAYCDRNAQQAHSVPRLAVVREPTPEPPPVTSQRRESEGASVTTPATGSFARRASDYEEEATTLTVSPALQHFVRKLEAFEHLVSSGNLAKAAIVAHDIRSVIAAFDPMIYLPNLLAPHFRLLSNNVEDLSPYWEQSGTPGWQALEQLYRVDLDAFVEG